MCKLRVSFDFTFYDQGHKLRDFRVIRELPAYPRVGEQVFPPICETDSQCGCNDSQCNSIVEANYVDKEVWGSFFVTETVWNLASDCDWDVQVYCRSDHYKPKN